MHPSTDARPEVRRGILLVAVCLAGSCLLGACAEERPLPDAGPPTVSVHPAGILDPVSADFHGRELERRNWDFSICASCHGADFSGGRAKVSCLQCHADGPTACTTCHGAGPTSNAHVVHREVGTLSCSECHITPAKWDDEGHILRGGVAITGPAQVTFGARAGLTMDPADRKGPPTWKDGRCSNVYCHGDALHAAGGVAPEPRWDDPAPAGDCRRCHGAPPPSHAQDRCQSCHPSDAPHIDGIVQVGRGPGCSGCHGDATSPAPPTDLSGNQLTTAIGVGAHRVHLEVPSRLRGPIPCGTCHLVPAGVDDPGHIDSALPAEVNAQLGWDRTMQTCETALCHIAARPVWTQTGGAECGSCHGIPPATPTHRGITQLTQCVNCHAKSVDATGTIRLTPGPGDTVTSTHINGVVDVF
jgi:predicted CxxxxCH...CXXCH cytochrome family protein